MKLILRKIINIVMYVLFIILMGYHITGNKVHEILGVITFIVFIFHNILNIKWYKTILKGKYTSKRVMMLIINALLLISFLITMISGIMISKSIFYNINKIHLLNARSIHLISTSWSFMLMSMHLGLHLTKVTSKITLSKDILLIVKIVISIIGIYIFIDMGYYKDLFLITKYKYIDFNLNYFIYYFNYLILSISFSIMTDIIYKIKRNRVKKNNER